jgi:hypothetical protein
MNTLLIKILAVVVSLILGIAIWVLVDFLASYSVEKPKLNKGVCPQCGRKLKFSRYMDAKTLAYNCIGDDHLHIAIVSNPYLKWKYCKDRKEV